MPLCESSCRPHLAPVEGSIAGTNELDGMSGARGISSEASSDDLPLSVDNAMQGDTRESKVDDTEFLNVSLELVESLPLVRVRLDELRPTQMAVGMQQVGPAVVQ